MTAKEYVSWLNSQFLEIETLYLTEKSKNINQNLVFKTYLNLLNKTSLHSAD